MRKEVYTRKARKPFKLLRKLYEKELYSKKSAHEYTRQKLSKEKRLEIKNRIRAQQARNRKKILLIYILVVLLLLLGVGLVYSKSMK